MKTRDWEPIHWEDSLSLGLPSATSQVNAVCSISIMCRRRSAAIFHAQESLLSQLAEGQGLRDGLKDGFQGCSGMGNEK